ncbi:uncharacterized protein LOC122275859 [Carya illinoinensis]|uniref:uncharacterized protein LOC122275859 n=1 Tax=Carya illinoinensis TaxID=32201 RepID=UPI001C7290BB|nr:uncharacterized protein LOC122275859 [Carya illinoinensis]
MRAEAEMKSFREALKVNELYDVGCVGSVFTWSNGHFDLSFTKERLDRYVVNNEWRNMFKDFMVEGLVTRCSDHKPMLMTVLQSESLRRKRKFIFRFEASWLKEEDCGKIVEKIWSERKQTQEPLMQAQKLLKLCSGYLTRSFRDRDKV